MLCYTLYCTIVACHHFEIKTDTKILKDKKNPSLTERKGHFFNKTPRGPLVDKRFSCKIPFSIITTADFVLLLLTRNLEIWMGEKRLIPFTEGTNLLYKACGSADTMVIFNTWTHTECFCKSLNLKQMLTAFEIMTASSLPSAPQ